MPEVVGIQKVNFRNKGAQLMLCAVQQRLPKLFGPDVVCAMPLRDGSWADRRQAGVRHLVQVDGNKLVLVRALANAAASCLPAVVRSKFHLVLERELSVVLDASGFSYSDQWGSSSARILARNIRRWKELGVPVILLPQAFGPFEKSEVRRYAAAALGQADLIFARDTVSAGHLRGLGLPDAAVSLAPDFTNLLTGRLPSDAAPLAGRPCIIPNARMIDKTGSGAAYLDFLNGVLDRLAASGRAPYFLIHDTRSDEELARRLAAAKPGVDVILEPDPVALKGILGTAEFVIGSRFHGLVSALSQGIPAVGTGWSHKYAELFRDYGASDLMIEDIGDRKRTADVIERLMDERERQALGAAIRMRADALKAQTEAMWTQVAAVAARAG